MITCERCNGIGYIAVHNGDDDVVCPVCDGAGERQLTLPEALKIVSDNAHGVKHNYWNEYLPAVLMVNEAFPVVGYVTVDDEWGDNRWSYGAMIERDNERVYSIKEQY